MWWVEEEAHANMTASFKSYKRPLVAVASFKYRGRVLTASYIEWTAAVNNIRKTWSKWARFSSIFGWKGANAWTATG